MVYKNGRGEAKKANKSGQSRSSSLEHSLAHPLFTFQITI